MPRVAAFLLLFFAAGIARAAGPQWLEVRTDHFDVLTNAGAGNARHTAAQLEEMRSVFAALLPASKSDDTRIVVLALQGDKDFDALEPIAYRAKGSLKMAGFFLPEQDVSYILLRLNAEGEHPFATVYHEYTHFIMRKAEWLPLWLNEGMAEFYQNTEIDQKMVHVGEPSADDILYLRENRLIPLATLLAVDHNSPYYHEEEKGSVFYSESWALTHYLMVNDVRAHTNKMRDYMNDLIKGEDPVTAAQHAFGDLGQLQRQLDNYVGGLTFARWNVKLGVTIDESKLDVHPVSQAYVDASRAAVMADVNRVDEAKALATSVLAQEPGNADAREVLGTIAFRERDIETARKWYAEAVKLDSKSFLAQYYFAVLSMRSSDNASPDAIEAALVQATTLNPRFAPAWDALAEFYATHHEKLNQAHIASVHAVQLDPTNVGYRRNAAQVLIENGQYLSAVGVLQTALPIARTAGEKASIQSQIESMQHMANADPTANTAPAASATGTVSATGSVPSAPTETRAVVRHPRPTAADGTVTVSSDDVSNSDAPRDATKPEATTTVTAMSEPDADTPHHPTVDPSGQTLVALGVIRNAKCFYPSILTFDVDTGGKTVSLYRNNFYKIEFTTSYASSAPVAPCSAINGRKARVAYATVPGDKTVAGQIVAVELEN